MKEIAVAQPKNVFEERESNVRAYARVFDDVFLRAKGSIMYAESGTAYIDFFAGAGALNYGHNNEYIKTKVKIGRASCRERVCQYV